MDAILKFVKPNLSIKFYFVYAESLSTEVENDPACVIRYLSDKAEFQDGRVCFSRSKLTIDDNIDIYVVNEDGHLTSKINPRSIVAYLNQISMYGIEVFLENYKKALVEFMEILSKQVACEDDDQRKASMKGTLTHISSLIFKISMHVKANGSFYHLRQELYEDSIFNLKSQK